MVRDANVVYEYMINNKIGHKDPKVHINLALHLEKYERNFTLASDAYTHGIQLVSDSERDQKIMLK